MLRMKKGFAHLIPLIAVFSLVSLTSLGIVGSARESNVQRSAVLSSSDKAFESKNKEKEKENKKITEETVKKTEVELKRSEKKEAPTPEPKRENKEEKQGIGGTESPRKLESSPAAGGDNFDDDDENEATVAVRPGRKIRSNFPITVNPVTNEKTVTTPSGTKTIVLPEVAIQNMIKAGFPVVLPPPVEESGEGSPSASPEGTPSGSTKSEEIIVDSEGEIQLSELNGELIYEIPAIKEENFLGLVPVEINVVGIVSAEDGEVINIEKSLFENILDLLSF